jgi:hypothetical protein
MSTGSVISPTPLNTSILGANVQRRDSTARSQRTDSGHVLHHRDSSAQLHSRFTSTSTWALAGPINSQIVLTGYNLNQSLNLGARPNLHFRSLSSPTVEGDARSASPVVGPGRGPVSDGIPKSNAKSMYKLCHRESSL